MQLAARCRIVCTGRLLGRLSRSWLVQPEAMGAQVGREVLSFRLGSLTHLILRPAVERRIAKNFRTALLFPRDRISRVPSDVVSGDGVAKMRIVVPVDMEAALGGQAHTDGAGGGGVADAQPGDWKHLVRQPQSLRDSFGVGPDHADAADT